MATTLTYTAGELCTEALREAGVVGVDRDPDANEMVMAIRRLNMFLKAKQNQAITIWKATTGSITLTDATTNYAISSRPLELGVVNYRDTSGNDRWLYGMGRQEYFELTDKDSAGDPGQYYYHRERTQGTLYVWPVQTTASGTIEWEGKAEIEDITATTDTVEVPSEWYEAILYGLAMRLSVAFRVKAVNPLLPGLATQAMAEAEGADVDGSIYFEPDYSA